MKVRLTILALALAACSGTPQPGDPGYSYNLDGEYDVEFSAVDGSVFSGTFQIETLPGGEVTGLLSISNPMSITGGLTGFIIGAEASLEMAFQIPDAGCDGIAEGSAVIEEGGAGATGSLEIIEDTCDSPPSMTFTLTRF